MSPEDWRTIDGYYEVSDQGRVRTPFKLLSIKTHKSGYQEVGIRGKTMKVHRLVAQAFVDNPYAKPEVNHINGIKGDNRAANLKWATRKEQQSHMVCVLRKSIREGHSQARLTWEKVREIRSMSGKTQKEISELFGVSQTAISKIMLNKVWQELE